VRIKSRRKRSTILEMVLDEGRNREIRRLLARVGHKVQKLKRIAVGPVRLGELPTGAVRPLTKKEIDSLQRAVTIGRRREKEVPAANQPFAQKSSSNRASHRGHREHRAGRTIIGK
jgi:23S rRNA pseudouridine2605 synthase